MRKDIPAINVLILCGGLGKRFREVSDSVPKVLADIDGQPFLHVLVDSLHNKGFNKFLLCVGYKADDVVEYFSKTELKSCIAFSKEDEPLGTGGAIKNAASHITSDMFLVLNGDSFCDINYAELIDAHVNNDALATIALAKQKDKDDFGGVSVDKNGCISSFNEKENNADAQYVNAGVYCFSKQVLDLMDEGNFSIEKEFFPSLVEKKFYGFPVEGELIDIGTPERYKLAIDKLKNVAG